MMCRVLGMPNYKFVAIGHPISSASQETLAGYARTTVEQARYCSFWSEADIWLSALGHWLSRTSWARSSGWPMTRGGERPSYFFTVPERGDGLLMPALNVGDWH